jgi:orotate phosphoribosyltransferase
MAMTQSNRKLLGQLAMYAYQWSPDKIFPLSSGEMSNEYLDCKRALSRPETMDELGPVICGLLEPAVVAIGGLTMGADPLAMSASQASARTAHPVRWFSVRKEAKKHGLQKQIEGCVERGERVAIADDVVTTGNSTVQAIKACREAGLIVVQVIVLVDREQLDGMGNIRRVGDCRVDAICTKSEIAAEWHRQRTNDLRATA